MVRIAGPCAGWRVLEPSAGTGNIVREIEKTDAAVVAVEIDPRLSNALRDSTPRVNRRDVRHGDFAELAAGLGSFDAVVMNPPFSQEIDHVRAAFGLLYEGGVLVAVMSAGVKFRSDAKHAEFRVWAEARGTIEPLPDDSFAPSGTSVRTVLVTLRK